MQNTHTLSKRVPAGKHDWNICKNVFNIYAPIMFADNRKNAAQFFFKALSFKHKPGVFKIELRLTREKYGEKCQIAVEACVFLKSKKLKKEKEMACFIPLS